MLSFKDIPILCLLYFIILCTADSIPKLPGVSWLTKSYNMMSGTDLSDKVDGAFDIFEWSWDPERTTDGDLVYLVPKEMSIPAMNLQCMVSVSSKSVKKCTSYTNIDEQVTERSLGFDEKVSLGVDVEGITAGTNIENSLMFGRSKTTINAFSKEQDSFTESFKLGASAKLYGTRMNWFGITFLDSFHHALKIVEKNPTNITFIEFFQEYGTHVLNSAKFGASCHETSFMRSAHESTDYSHFKESVKTDRLSYLFWSLSSSHIHKKNESGTTSYGVQYSFDDIQCSGEVMVDNICESITGKSNAPTVASFQLLPIWKIPGIPYLKQETIEAMDAFSKSILSSGALCRKAHCQSHGVCQPDGKVWDPLHSWDGKNFSAFWETTCFCDFGWEGSSCEQKISPCNSPDSCPCTENHINCPQKGLCNPQESSCMASTPKNFCANKFGVFETCQTGVMTGSCGSGGDYDCGRSGDCPKDTGHAIRCDFNELALSERLTDWKCGNKGQQMSCDQIGGGVLVGQCQSGDHTDCKQHCVGSVAIQCDMSVDIDTKSCKWLSGGFGIFLNCPQNYVATGICGSGEHTDCPNNAVHQLQCCRLKFF